jgi:flagellar hook assembly protein FlgD
MPAGGAREVQRLSVAVKLESAGLVSVRVYDAMGREVRTLHAGVLEAGTWSFTWDGKAEDGSPASPGRYRLETRSGATTLVKDLEVLP